MTDTDHANPQCLVFSPQSSNGTIFFRDRNIYKTCILLSPNVFFLNIAKTNYKVVTGPVTSGSNFLRVQKHFALVQYPILTNKTCLIKLGLTNKYQPKKNVELTFT